MVQDSDSLIQAHYSKKDPEMGPFAILPLKGPNLGHFGHWLPLDNPFATFGIQAKEDTYA